jgi:ankyrin repeat protein
LFCAVCLKAPLTFGKTNHFSYRRMDADVNSCMIKDHDLDMMTVSTLMLLLEMYNLRNKIDICNSDILDDQRFARDGIFICREERQNSNVQALNRILDTGVDINLGNACDETALQLAAMYGHRGVISRLIEIGARITVLDSKRRTPPHLGAGDVMQACFLAF